MNLLDIKKISIENVYEAIDTLYCDECYEEMLESGRFLTVIDGNNVNYMFCDIMCLKIHNI